MRVSISSEKFESIAQEIFDSLPAALQHHIENVHIVVEDVPRDETRRKVGISQGGLLLGLYEGVPLNHRSSAYGTYPVTPDKITLYKNNIELVSTSLSSLRETIRDVLIHEIAHYYGMDEKQVRDAGY